MVSRAVAVSLLIMVSNGIHEVAVGDAVDVQDGSQSPGGCVKDYGYRGGRRKMTCYTPRSGELARLASEEEHQPFE